MKGLQCLKVTPTSVFFAAVSQGGFPYTTPGAFLLSELWFGLVLSSGIEDGFAYRHQLLETEMVAVPQPTSEKKRKGKTYTPELASGELEPHPCLTSCLCLT